MVIQLVRLLDFVTGVQLELFYALDYLHLFKGIAIYVLCWF